MVYTGPSQACMNCRKRRVKCDLERPFCNNCRKRGVVCLGYKEEVPIRWQDETDTVVERFERKRQARRRQQESSTLSSPGASLEADLETTALAFFFKNYMLIGSGDGPIIGFLESIVSTLHPSADQSSALSRSVSALSTCTYGLWSGEGPSTPLAQMQLGLALSAVQDALKDPQARLRDGTLASVLLLNMLDDISAWFNGSEISSSHLTGALALINHRGVHNFQTETARSLWLYARRTAICEALTGSSHKLPEFLGSIDPALLPPGPEIDLDSIGTSLASLHAQFHDMRTSQSSSDLLDLLHAASQIDEEFIAWSEMQTTAWRPVSFSGPDQLPPSINQSDFYEDRCEVYPSTHVAGIWSTYRGYRLIVQKIILLCHTHLLDSFPEVAMAVSSMSTHRAAEVFQKLLDDVCGSVPYYLGHGTNTHTSELSSIPAGDQAEIFLHPAPSASNLIPANIQQADRMRNALAMGSWRVAVPLNQILSMLMNADGYVFRPLLRDGQQEWISTQVERVMRLHSTEVVRAASESRESSASRKIVS